MEISEAAKDAAKYIDWREYKDDLCDGCPYYNPEDNDPCSYVHEKSGFISCVRIAECVQQAIDESTAKKDAEIEGLLEKVELYDKERDIYTSAWKKKADDAETENERLKGWLKDQAVCLSGHVTGLNCRGPVMDDKVSEDIKLFLMGELKAQTGEEG